MHNVDVEAVERTAAEAEADPGSVVQHVAFEGGWQTSERAPQFRVRGGIAVDVSVEPCAQVASSSDARETSVAAG